MTSPKVPEFSNEAIVTSVGVTIVQALDLLANEMSLSDEDTQKLWSPFLAATARLIKPADNMAAVFQNAAKTKKVSNRATASVSFMRAGIKLNLSKTSWHFAHQHQVFQ